MKKNDNLKRSGFHSVESIIKNNPHKIKKLFLPSSRDDKRINILEYGTGWSSLVISHALKLNKKKYINKIKDLRFKYEKFNFL